jgi:hypothetical protein
LVSSSASSTKEKGAASPKEKPPHHLRGADRSRGPSGPLHEAGLKAGSYITPIVR